MARLISPITHGAPELAKLSVIDPPRETAITREAWYMDSVSPQNTPAGGQPRKEGAGEDEDAEEDAEEDGVVEEGVMSIPSYP